MIIGITGSFGTGKTTVARFFSKSGCKVIDADKIAHRVLKKDTPAYKRIVSTFGNRILKKDKSIDRRKLADAVFNSRKSLNRLCRITHPSVISEIKKIVLGVRRKTPKRIIVIDAPLLIEANMAGYIDKLIVVRAPLAKQIERCKGKFRITASGVKKRIKSQLPISQKIKFADFVIDNSGNLSQTLRQVKRIYGSILTRNKRF